MILFGNSIDNGDDIYKRIENCKYAYVMDGFRSL